MNWNAVGAIGQILGSLATFVNLRTHEAGFDSHLVKPIDAQLEPWRTAAPFSLGQPFSAKRRSSTSSNVTTCAR